MTDGPTSEQLRGRASRYIDPRGRLSVPGHYVSTHSQIDLLEEELRMREEVEGYGRVRPKQ